MPPKKSAAAVVDQNAPTLKLVVEKGPSSGHTLDSRPGSEVKIGRLVRGNTIAIKDSGISSKHLRIEIDAASDPDRRRWIITDLDSSNGTFLNDDQLVPLEPTALSDGDLIKIGEETTIRVTFSVGAAENEAGSVNVRRNARRRVRGLDVIGEDAELGLRNSEDVEKVVEIEAKQGKSVGTRRTRTSAKNENLANDLGLSEIKGSVGISTRRTRNSKKEENVDEIAVDVSVIEVKKPGGRGRGRKKQPVEAISEEIEKEEPRSSHKACEEEKERSKVAVDELEEKENVNEIAVDVSVIEVKKPGGRGRGRKKQPVQTLSKEIEKGVPRPSHKACEEEKESSVVAVDELEAEVKTSGTDGVAAGLASSSGVKERSEVAVDELEAEVKTSGTDGGVAGLASSSGVKDISEVAVDESEAEVENSGTDGGAAGLASSSGVKECDVEEAGKGKIVLDLEKMTLGEWFDYIEVHETQCIIDKSEEMLTEMRRKAERCHEYMLQQKRLRG